MSMVMTFAAGGTNLAGFGIFLASDGLATGLSSWIGLEALQVFAGDWTIFCLLGVLSSACSFSFSFRTS
jgi:hypothetical protein